MLSFRCFTRHVLTLCALLPLLTPLVAGDDLSWVPFDRKQFNGNAALDSKGNVQLFWKIGSNYSTYGIASKSKGYLAVGFSETGAMTGADIALGYMGASNKFVLENRNAAGFVTPQLSNDQKNNLHLKEGSQKNGVTGFVFEKKNQADCLQTQANVNTDSWQWFIYAFSDSNTFAQHGPGDNGNKYVKLGTGQTISINEAQNIPNAKNFTITQPEVTVSTNETTYCYTLHKLPAGQKNFILGERPTSTSTLVHHQVIYSCWNITDEEKKMEGQAPNCDYENFQNPCYGFVTEWAPGMSARTYESGYGKPFGSDSYEYVMLETHFNNPQGLSGQKASAGYTFLYDDKPVQHEIGTLTLGDIQVTGWALDPGKALVSKQTVCTPECTKNWPSDGISAFSVFFHMHTRGRNARVQVIRDGKEVTPLATIRNFEYGYQFSKTIPEFKLLPGDRLITTCEYDTTKDTKPVPGGLASKDEMCFAWVDYYPATDVLICSEVDLGQDPSNLLNGTIAYCQKKNTDPESSINPFAPLNATWQALPVTGNTCSNTSSGSPDTQSTKPSSSALSAYGSLSRDTFSLLASCLFVIIFALEIL